MAGLANFNIGIETYIKINITGQIGQLGIDVGDGRWLLAWQVRCRHCLSKSYRVIGLQRVKMRPR
jgi:hypothetical protein